jgi:uncharacterized DUF497 family protein
MRFEWDPKKNEINIRERGVDFADAKEMFEHGLLGAPDTRKSYGEKNLMELDTFRIDSWWWYLPNAV